MLMSYFQIVAAALATTSVTQAVSESSNITQDRFYYRETNWTDNIFGPNHWDLVKCADVNTCPGWPTNWDDFTSFIPYANSTNRCIDCADSTTGACSQHQQSPIHLFRNVTAQRKCYDRHMMHFRKGNCLFQDMTFEILPHALRANQPPKCGFEPMIDFSRGFPVPWKLDFTDISVPSQHTQDGKRYDAEVVLSHSYSKDDKTKVIGNVAIFLEMGNETDSYDFLELYISQWQMEMQRVRSSCELRRLSGGSSEPTAEPTRMPEARNQPELLHRPVYSRDFHPYQWIVEAATEYYFRYEGSTLVPPCLQTVEWRVLKNPIKVAPSQIRLLELMIAKRINPETCEYDTAGKQREDGNWRVDVNRPSQTTTSAHKLVYCECVNWKSKTANDREYCRLPMEQRGVYNLTIG